MDAIPPPPKKKNNNNNNNNPVWFTLRRKKEKWLGEPKTSGNQDVLKWSTNVHGLSYKKLDGMNVEYVFF